MPPVDFLIITALEKEAKAVVSRLENHTIERSQDRNIRTYHCGTVRIGNTDRAYRVVVIVLPGMGELSAANATTDALADWNPQFVLMVGIAGGIAQDDLNLGDVVVADQVIGYDYGKQYDGFIKPRDHVYPASALLLERVRNFWDDSWAQHVDVPRPAKASRATSKHFVGPIASGNKVIASKEFQATLLTRWPKLIAIETEAEGVFAAVFDRPQIKGTLVIRGICDMADKDKDDAWQEYAANAAAAYTVDFLKSGPVDVGASHDSPTPPQPDKISTSKLPSTSSDLFGREAELAALDKAWADSLTNVLTLVAWGGVGKTALVGNWLSRLAADNYRGAERVFGWSFYSQGAAEGRQVSADQFIAAALKWFGDPQMAESSASPWDKGERLAELIRQSRTLLILDGVEPLQNPPPVETGRLKDPALSTLLRELARHNPGLVVITTRLAVDDLKDFLPLLSATGDTKVGFRTGRGGGATQIDLEMLSDEAGAQYLSRLGVQGTDDELRQASHDFGGHALALTLLGTYLSKVHRGDVRKRDLIAHLTDERKQGAHARRVLASYEHWLNGKAELDILRLMGLFDRPAERGAVEALRREPPIQSLTSNLQSLSDADWQYAVSNLRDLRLLAAADDDPDTLDCHPLLREHFGEQLRMSNIKAWREAHSRLYEYYKTSAKELPDTLEEMTPLYAAVAHGCQAGRHQDAFLVYYRQIQRGGDVNYCCAQLGAFGADLAALSGFFDAPWCQPVAAFREDIKSFVLNAAGFRLRAFGRLSEATQPLQAGLEANIARKDWKNAARVASNLSELYLTMGDLAQALNYARQGVELADRSGDAFLRIVNRTTLADALHQAGRVSEAEAAFREAEEMQKQNQPQFPLLYSLWGFRYCDLLLSQGQYQEVQSRASQTMEWTKQHGSLLDVALDNLSPGRAYFLQSLSPRGRCAPEAISTPRGGILHNDEALSSAATHLRRAVDGLRQAGMQDYLPRGLLARAELHRFTGAFAKALNDLDEAFSIATRGGMRLHETDCHLEYARLYVAMNDTDKARAHFVKARQMVEEIGYRRRDGEVKELEEMNNVQ